VMKFLNLFGVNPGQIPPGSQINRATLKFKVTDPGNLLRIRRLTEPWNEATVTFNGTFTDPGADGPTSSAGNPVDVSAAQDEHVVTALITEFVQAWSANPASNHGIVILDTGIDGVQITSSDGGDPPVLCVDFGQVLETQDIHQVLADYQSLSRGGEGWMRLMRFVPAEDRVYVRTFSPTRNEFGLNVIGDSQFELDYNMSGGFQLAGPVQQKPAGGPANVSVVPTGLIPDTEFEWFVEVKEGAGSIVTSPVFRFRTPSVTFVNAANPTPGDGTSWAAAFNSLPQALAEGTGTELWVAAGTYKPGTLRSHSFNIPSGKAVFGGFSGTETSRAARDLEANVTILSGDLAGNDGPGFANYGENAFHVVKAVGTSTQTVLDGFVVLGGNANGAPGTDDLGGGLFTSGSLKVTNCKFLANRAATGGGAFSRSGTVTYTNCLFSGNDTDPGAGGGFFGEFDIIGKFINCTFSRNHARWTGGGLYSRNSFVVLEVTNCIFWGNSADYASNGVVTQVDLTQSWDQVTYCCIQYLGSLAGTG
ncbi:MAG: DNRLRE domain-containing protein, partial [Thermoanaerobaculia bacterium]